MSRAFLAVCFSALAATGCGVVASSNPAGDDGEASAAPFSLGKPQARALARSMLIRPTDLPRWGKEDGGKQVNASEAIRNTKLPDPCDRLGKLPDRWIMGEALSPIFLKFPERAFVASGAWLFRTEAEARKAFARTVRAARGKRGQACFLATLRSGGAEAGISFNRQRVRPIRYQLAQQAWGFRWDLRVGGAAAFLKRVDTAFVFMQERQAVSFMVTGRYTEPFDRELEVRLGRLVAKRMRAAQDAQTS
jgi:hypothetical protein